MRDRSEGQSSQTVRAQLKLREFILNGDVTAGERMSELALVDRLRVSRRRSARPWLGSSRRGCCARCQPAALSSTRSTSATSIPQSRFAARSKASRRDSRRNAVWPRAASTDLDACVAALDQLVFGDGVTVDNFSSYVKLNEQFHTYRHRPRRQRDPVSENRTRRHASIRIRRGIRDGAGEPAPGPASCSPSRRISIVASCGRLRRTKANAPKC